jgi:hypothetical protein
MTTTKRTPKTPDLRTLANAVVDKRLAFLNGDYLDFVDPPAEMQETPLAEWNALLTAARARFYPEVTEEMIDRVRESAGDELAALEEGCAAAGFVVGLELGRRLAGGGR